MVKINSIRMVQFSAVFPFVGLLSAVAGEEMVKEVTEILQATGPKPGLLVHLNGGDGKLTAALAQGGNFQVHGMESDKALVDEARRTI